MDGDSGDDGRDEQVRVEECEGELLGWGWQNEAGSWFQRLRQADAYRIKMINLWF